MSHNVKLEKFREINVTKTIKFSKIIDIFSKMHYSGNTNFLTNFSIFGGASMERNTKPRNLPSLVEDINNNKYNFSHPLQRRSGQWSSLQNSELIESILRDFGIDPVTIVTNLIDEETGESISLNNAVIDGIQRLTCFKSFLNNEFRLSKKLEDEPFMIEGVTYLPSEHLCGKKYDELDEKIKDKIKAFDLMLDIYSNATEKEIRTLFKRKNSGKPLTKAQKNTVNISDEMFIHIKEVLDADGFIIKLEKRNRAGEIVMKNGEPVIKEKKIANFWNRTLGLGVFKNGEDRNIVMETLMLTTDYGKTHEFGYRIEDIQSFTNWFDGLDAETQSNAISLVVSAADSLNKRMDGKIRNLKKTSVPMVVAGMCVLIKNKGGKDKYMTKVKEFFADYENNIDYRKLAVDASASKENVSARWKVFSDMAKGC